MKRLNHGVDSLPPFSIGHANHRHILDLCMLTQGPFNFGGIHVGSSRDDEIGAPIGQKQVPLLVHPPQVADTDEIPSGCFSAL